MTTKPQGGITVSYSGVHQAFQLALAAQEAGALDAFLCSLYGATGKWGGLLERLTGRHLLSRKVDGLELAAVKENPWPLLRKLGRDKLSPSRREEWHSTNDSFDRWAARRFRDQGSTVFVGTETCDLHCLRAARSLGAVTVHDCPQIHPDRLAGLMNEAAQLAEMKLDPASSDGTEMLERKLEEYSLADWLLVYSDFHRDSFVRAGFASDHIFQTPLWVDCEFWARPASHPTRQPDGDKSLRVLYAGSISLRKGIPFLIEAARRCPKNVTVTLVGGVSSDLRQAVQNLPENVVWKGPLTKTELRNAYSHHDLFILPSVVDSFGFVALEAMACGLPAIVSNNCGVPVPCASWRVPAMDAQALSERMLYFLDHPEALIELSSTARGFASQFTPQRYRNALRDLFVGLLP